MSRNVLKAIAVLGVIGFSLQVNAQPRTTYFNFVVNGSSDTIMTQGDIMAWECNCGLGDTLTGELWLDLNASHTIDAGDKLWIMCPFRIIDGMTDWNQGPADSSAVLDGIFYCALPPNWALAPGNYVMKVENWVDASTAENWLLIKPHSSPPVTVSGTVSIEGVSAPNPLLNALWVCTDMDKEPWWSAITDSYGVYTLNLPDTGTWHVLVADDIPPYIRPGATELYVTANTSGIDFLYEQPNAFVYGTVKDDRDSLLPKEVEVWWDNETTGQDGWQQTSNGTFSFGMDTGAIHLGVSRDDLIPDWLEPPYYELTLGDEDSLEKNFVCYRTDTSIYGWVTENDSLPSKSYMLDAYNNTIGSTETMSDSLTGLFELRVASGTSKNGIAYWVHLNEWKTQLPPGFVFEEGNGRNAGPGDTVYVKLVSYKGSVSGSLSVAPGDPAPDFDLFSVGMIDTATWQTKAQSQIESNGTYKVSAPEGTWHIELWCPEEWLSFPARIEGVIVDTFDVPNQDFIVNYGHCTLSGMLHGLFDVPEDVYVGANGDSAWPHGYSKSSRVNQSDSSYSFKICDAKWTVNAPWIDGYEHIPQDTTFPIGDLDSSATVDFYYTPVRYLEWTGATGFVEDGINPDTGVEGGTFEFQVKYTDIYNDSPYVYEVWIDLNDDLGYAPTEEFAMTEVDAGDLDYSDGKDYTLSMPIDYAGDGVLDYRFYFENQGGGITLGFPNSDNQVVIKKVGVDGGKVPLITILYPVAPNPSGGVISIKYGVGVSGCDKVSLKVYDVTGRAVRTLVNSQKEPGTYTIKWNGENDTETELANGIYFCKFKSGDYQSTRKVILLR